ncbi:MAG: lipopolysaccharide assembly protein LapA domain-containing protein [Paracoccaceae bacterium]
MRYLKYLFWGIVAIGLIVLGLANREPVTLRALPEGLARLIGVSPDIAMPLWAAILIGVALGLLIGFVWEYIREYKIRAEARRKAREARRLEVEVDRLKAEKHKGRDDVLAVLEQKS